MGKHIGRPKGRKPKHYKLSGKGAYIKRELLKGRSKTSLARELYVSRATLRKYMILMKITKRNNYVHKNVHKINSV